MSDTISALDRGFLYGQSLFETIALSNRYPHLLELHLQRLLQGCNTLGIPYPSELESDIDAICQSVELNTKVVLRVTLSMGIGGRGYLNPAQPSTNRVLSLHDYPEHPSEYWSEGINCGVASIRLAQQPALAGLKHGNRIEQTIARSQWPKNDKGQSSWQEALMLDTADNAVEGTQSNLFILDNGVLKTPRLDYAGVAGVMRETILQSAESLGVSSQVVSLSLADIEQADAVFFSNSLVGVWPVKRLNDTHYKDFAFAHKLMTYLVKNGAIPTF